MKEGPKSRGPDESSGDVEPIITASLEGGNVPALYEALTKKLQGEQLSDAIDRYNEAIADGKKSWKRFAWNNNRSRTDLREYQRAIQEAAREAAREAREQAREAAKSAREEAREAREEALREAEERRQELEENQREQAREYARQLEQLRREKERLKERAEQLKHEALQLDSAMKELKKNLKGTPEADVDVDVE